MNFDHAISAHASWKVKLKAYIAKPDRTLKPAEVAQDNRCDLGKWIATESSKHASLPEFQTLRTEHARFHKAAADVIRRADSGQDVSEEVALGARSEFSAASVAVVNAILLLKAKVEKPVVVNR